MVPLSITVGIPFADTVLLADKVFTDLKPGGKKLKGIVKIITFRNFTISKCVWCRSKSSTQTEKQKMNLYFLPISSMNAPLFFISRCNSAPFSRDQS